MEDGGLVLIYHFFSVFITEYRHIYPSVNNQSDEVSLHFGLSVDDGNRLHTVYA